MLDALIMQMKIKYETMMPSQPIRRHCSTRHALGLQPEIHPARVNIQGPASPDHPCPIILRLRTVLGPSTVDQ